MDGVEFNCSHFATPYITDWNCDGINDLICGDLEGKVHLLINEGTNANPVFNESRYVQDGPGDLQTGIRNTPVVADWNRDNKKDLLIGAYHGFIEYFENKGTDENPVFDGRILLEVAPGQPLHVGQYSRPDVADWDEDGEVDILCGESDGFVYYFHAKGPLSVDVNSISKTAGGSIRFQLDPGSEYGERRYFLMGTESGTEPGTVLPGGAILPLNWGNLSWYIFFHYNTHTLADFRGELNLAGNATAFLNAPPSLLLPIGTVLHFAFTTENPYDFQSKPLTIEIVP